MTATETTPTDAWSSRIAAARDARARAAAAEERTIRDAVAGGMTPSAIARTLGTQNRQRIYAILGRGEDGQDPAPPTQPPVIYLRGAGIGPTTWGRVERAMWARGWLTTHDRTTAWHLARGGVPVVFCDFSADYLDSDDVVVGRARARYQDATADDGTPYQEMDLPLVNGGRGSRPERYDPELTNKAGQQGAVCLDETVLARMVADALDAH